MSSGYEAWKKEILENIPLEAWGSFSLPNISKFRTPKPPAVSAVNVVRNEQSARLTEADTNLIGKALDKESIYAWYPSPPNASNGAEARVEVSINDRTGLLSHIFPADWWLAAQKDLQFLLANKPKSVKENKYALVAWTIQVSWLVYHMLLASNIYPTWWAQCLTLLEDPDYEFPSYFLLGKLFNPFFQYQLRGRDPEPLYWSWLFVDPLSQSTGLPVSVQGGAWQGVISNPAGPLWWGGKYNKNHPAVMMTGAFPGENLGLATKELPWSGTRFRGTYAGRNISWREFDKISIDKDLVAWSKRVDPTGKFGLGNLVLNSMFFHIDGLVGLTEALLEGPSKQFYDVVETWRVLGVRFSKISYWEFVRAGVKVWRIRSTFLEQRTGGDPRLPIARQDYQKIYDDYKAQNRKQFLIAPLVKWAMTAFKLLRQAYSGNIAGLIKTGVDYVKWGKKASEQTALVPPHRSFFMIDALFIRGPLNWFDVYGDLVVYKGTEDEVVGTEALYVGLENAVRRVEQTLGRWLWEEPTPKVQHQTTKAGAKATASVEPTFYLVPTSPEGLKPKTSSTVWWVLGAAAGVTTLAFWRRK